MANTCRPQVQACAIRVAKLYSTGVPRVGANNLYVSDALTKLTMTPVIEEGSETKLKNACGAACLDYKDCDRLSRLDISIELCTPDPELSEMFTTGVVLTSGAAVGFGAPVLNEETCPDGISIELWAKRPLRGGSLDPVHPYAWWVFPRVYLHPADSTFEDGPFVATFAGFGVENENWFDGPLNDWPVDSDRVYQWLPTATLPETACGYASLVAS